MNNSYDVEDTGQHFMCVLDLRSRSKVTASPKPFDVATSKLQMLWLDKKQVFAMVYCRLKSSYVFRKMQVWFVVLKSTTMVMPRGSVKLTTFFLGKLKLST